MGKWLFVGAFGFGCAVIVLVCDQLELFGRGTVTQLIFVLDVVASVAMAFVGRTGGRPMTLPPGSGRTGHDQLQH